jgi:hypothetical protein
VKPSPTLTAATVLACVVLSPGCGSPNRPATWSYISPVIFQPNCASGSCHDPATAAAGLDFSTPDRGYTSLTGLWVWIVDPSKAGAAGCGHPAGTKAGTIVCERMYRPLVTPYDPAQSRLISVLRGRDAPRMPPDRPLDEADIELVEDWILNGARKSESQPSDGGGGDVIPLADGAAGDAASGDAPEASTEGGADGASDGALDGGADGAVDAVDAHGETAGN